jgi:dienelactone hydrolase
MTDRLNPTQSRPRRWRLLDVLIAVAAVGLMAAGLLWLSGSNRGLVDSEVKLEQAPVTVYSPLDAEHAPVAVIAHGFSGSRQMMQPFATTLARNGYVTVSFDFPGHGANPLPLEGKIGDPERTDALLKAVEQVVDYATTLPQFDGRLALVGHSMAGDIAARYARASEPPANNPEVADAPGADEQPAAPVARVDALVAVSPYLSQEIGEHDPGATPNNMLFIYGGLEPETIHAQGRNAVAAVAGLPADEIAAEVTYGDHGDGSARRLVIADGVEHIGVLYSAQTLEATLEWLNKVFGRQASGWVDARGPWLIIYFLGVVLLAWPLARLLPRVSDEPLGANLEWSRMLPAALLPALLTPLILRPFPSDFLAIAIADYIALHFAVYALLTGIALLLLGGFTPGGGRRISIGAFLGALIAVVLYQTITIAIPADRYVVACLPGTHRWGILLVLLGATTAWFATDEWLTRGANAVAGAYPLTKALFLLSLLFAVALNLGELFFLVIIVPAILILFIVFGLFSRWIYRRTGHPLVAALANALAFAVAITASFPIAE